MNSLKEWFNDEEYLAIISDLLSNKEVLKMSNYVHHYFTNRLEHSIAVSYISYKKAKKKGLDFRSVARAGLLHDFYLMTTKEVESLGRGSHNNLHPKLALENAKKITDINEIEEDIILKHMFGAALVRTPKYRESMIVTIVDKQVAIMEVFLPMYLLAKYGIAKTVHAISY